ncbi:uncharacterized protein LOC116947455 isoform X4 [Petromyzon marinus]|uniref:uncharacterized protein LOC116947455 isoform X4 n=1 Tax=Petromyzon marinus TaxID=7757 RepID=UPI003F724119
MEDIVPVKTTTRSLRQGFSREFTETNKRIEDLQAIITARSLNQKKLHGARLPSSKPAQLHSDGNKLRVMQMMHHDNGDAGDAGGGGVCSDDGHATVIQLGEEVATVETAPDTDQTWERRGTFFVIPQGLRFDPQSCSNRDDASPQATGDDDDDEDGGGGDGWARASVEEDEVETTRQMERTRERRRTLLMLPQAPESGFQSANWGPRLNVVRLVAAMPTVDSSPTLSERRSHGEAEGPADPLWLANSTTSSERLGHEDDDSREEAERFASEPAELPNKMVLHLSTSEASDDMELAHCPGPAPQKEIPRVEGGEPAVPSGDPTQRAGTSWGNDGTDAPGKLSPPEEVVSRSEALLPSLSETLDDAEMAHCPGLATPKGIPRGEGGDPALPDDPTRHAGTSRGNGIVDGEVEEEEVTVCASEAPLPSLSDDSSQSRSPTPPPPAAVGKAHKRKLEEGGGGGGDPLADPPVAAREGADTAEAKAGPKHSRRQPEKQGGEHGTTAQPAQRRKWGARVPPAAAATSQQSGGAPTLGKPRAKRAATTSTLRVTRTLTLQQEAAATAAPATSPTAASTTAAAPAANAAILAAATTAATSPTVAASTNAAAPTTADSPADIVPNAAPGAAPGAAALDKVEAAEPLKEKTPETARREGSQRKTKASATVKDLSGLTGESSTTTTTRSQKKVATEGKAMTKGKGEGKPRGRGAAQGELEKETTEASGQPENLGICTPPLPPAPPPTPTESDSPPEGAAAGAEKTPESRQRSLRARGPQASVKALSLSPGPKPTRRLRSKALAIITEGETLKSQDKGTGGKGKAVATAEGKAKGKRTTRVAQQELKNEAASGQPKTRRIGALPASSPPTPSESDPPEGAAAGTEKTPQRRQRSLRSQGPQVSVKALTPSPGPKPTLRQRSKALSTITDGETLKTDAADGKPILKKRLRLAPGKGQ